MHIQPWTKVSSMSDKISNLFIMCMTEVNKIKNTSMLAIDTI
jgi:hypothetical protein